MALMKLIGPTKVGMWKPPNYGEIPKKEIDSGEIYTKMDVQQKAPDGDLSNTKIFAISNVSTQGSGMYQSSGKYKFPWYDEEEMEIDEGSGISQYLSGVKSLPKMYKETVKKVKEEAPKVMKAAKKLIARNSPKGSDSFQNRMNMRLKGKGDEYEDMIEIDDIASQIRNIKGNPSKKLHSYK